MHIREKQFFVLLSPALHLPWMQTSWEWGWGALGVAGGWIQRGKRQERVEPHSGVGLNHSPVHHGATGSIIRKHSNSSHSAPLTLHQRRTLTRKVSHPLSETPTKYTKVVIKPGLSPIWKDPQIPVWEPKELKLI